MVRDGCVHVLQGLCCRWVAAGWSSGGGRGDLGRVRSWVLPAVFVGCCSGLRLAPSGKRLLSLSKASKYVSLRALAAFGSRRRFSEEGVAELLTSRPAALSTGT